MLVLKKKYLFLPVDNYAANIEVEAKGDTSVVTWKAGFLSRLHTNNNPPPEMNEEAANTAVKAVFKDGLESLKKISRKII